MLRLGAVRRKQLRTKKSHGDAPSKSSNRCLFTPIAVTQRQNSTSKIVHCASGIVLTYTFNEFMSPRVKFLPKTAPLDCALLPFALTRHFSAGTSAGKRKQCVNALTYVDEEGNNSHAHVSASGRIQNKCSQLNSNLV